MKIDVISLFPDIITSYFDEGVVGRAVKNDIFDLQVVNPRDFTSDVHQSVDDRPYGGGPGMVMSYSAIKSALQSVSETSPHKAYKIYLTPQGQRLNHQMVEELSQKEHLVLLCGRYEGVDERVITEEIDLECSLGDFVLSGGELAALALIDSVARLMPEVLGHDESARNDSFAQGTHGGLLDCPHYTRPESVNGKQVPEVLLSGNHQLIDRYRLEQSLGNSWIKRPDLFAKKVLSEAELCLLNNFLKQYR